MNKYFFSLICLICFSLQSINAQTINIFISDPVGDFPDVNLVNNMYLDAGFTTVNISPSPINSNLTTANFDLAIINEYYDISSESPLFLNNSQRQIVENFISSGGHVIWIAENLFTYPISGTPAPANTNATTTINNLYNTSLSYGNSYNNGGMGSPNLPRIHPSNGPGALSSSLSLLSSGSYATLLNVPILSAIYTSDAFDNTNSFDICTHTTLALFPEQVLPSSGSIIISTELQIPYTIDPITSTAYNPMLDTAIANLHHTLITNANTSNINNWSSDPNNVNQTCVALEAIISASDSSICQGDTLAFTNASFGNPTSWTWTFTTGTPSSANTQGPHNIVFNTIGTHNIMLQISDGFTTDDTTIQIVVNPSPSVSAGANDTICQGQSITLTAQNPNSAAISWNNGIQDGVAFTPNTSSSYTVSATLNGCTTTDTKDVIVNMVYQVDQNISLCNGDSFQLANGNYVNAIGSYPVTVTSSKGCDSTINTFINYTDTGIFELLSDTSICSGFNTVLNTNAQNMVNIEWFVNDGSGFTSLLGNPDYNGADSSALIIFLDTTLSGNQYRVNMIDSCSNTYSTSMTLTISTPKPIANPLPDQVFCEHESNILGVEYDGRNFEWNTGAFGRFIEPIASGTYTVQYVQAQTNCTITDDIEVSIENCIDNCVVLLPTGFSPNNDGANDLFKIISNCKDGFSFFKFQVFNRWGEEVLYTEDINFEWNAVYKNKVLPIGNYSYLLQYTKNFDTEQKIEKGNISIIK